MELYACLWETELLPKERDALSPLLRALPFGSAEEERLRAIRHLPTLLQSLGGKLALERLARERHLPPPLTVLRTETGKPYFENSALPTFSLSHSQGLALAVLSDRPHAPIGADLQFVTDRRDALRLAARCLNEEEMGACAQSEDPRQIFYRLWTKKEALAKQSGKGLSEIFSGRVSESGKHVRTLRLRYGGETAYLSVAAPEEITAFHLSTPWEGLSGKALDICDD